MIRLKDEQELKQENHKMNKKFNSKPKITSIIKPKDEIKKLKKN